MWACESTLKGMRAQCAKPQGASGVTNLHCSAITPPAASGAAAANGAALPRLPAACFALPSVGREWAC